VEPLFLTGELRESIPPSGRNEESPSKLSGMIDTMDGPRMTRIVDWSVAGLYFLCMLLTLRWRGMTQRKATKQRKGRLVWAAHSC
jgi:hypothetical protein